MAVESPPAPQTELPASQAAAEPQVSPMFAAMEGLLDAGRPLIYIQSAEEDRVIGLLARIAAARRGGPSELFVWSLTEGLQPHGTTSAAAPSDARGILDHIIVHEKPGIFLLKDFHEFIGQGADIRRRLRDLYYHCLDTGKFAVICSPVKCIPEEIHHEMAFMELLSPDLKELAEMVTEQTRSILGAEASASLTAETIYTLARGVQGLTFHEARHALRRAMAEHGKLDGSIQQTLEREKQQLVRKSGLVEFVPNAADISQIGGLQTLKKWLTQRRGLFFSRESLSREIIPKGLLLMGISGCGKSLSARVIANVFGLPLYRIDMIQVFSAGIGNAEKHFSAACRTLEDVSPAVAWFDEIEDVISRQHQDSSGVLDRIFSFFLTWMQEKVPGLFVVATANRIDLLPAEMIRKGRFDQIFFIDLPDYDERMEILQIHLSRRGLDSSGMDLDSIAARTEGWTGAEIEQAVISSIIAAKIANELVSDNALHNTLRQIVPLSRTMKEQVTHIRSWASDRAVRATPKRLS
jgi:ATP-dependent 26S proteasome regulatory subunit